MFPFDPFVGNENTYVSPRREAGAVFWGHGRTCILAGNKNAMEWQPHQGTQDTGE